MRLLHVVASYLPATRYGGTIVSVHGLCRALAERGHDVHVYTTSVDGPTDSDVPHDRVVDVQGVKVSYFRSATLRRLYWAPALATAVRARIAEFDVVHTHAVFLWPLWVAAREARRAGVPYVVSPRGMLERELICQKNPLFKALWIAAIERHNLAGAAAIHVTSAREADEMAALGLRLPRLSEIPNGVTVDDAGQPSPAIAQLVADRPYILFLGRVNWKKGLDRLLAAVARLPAVTLVIAGMDEDGYRSTVKALAERLQVASQVVFTGEVHAADKAVLLHNARALVLPSYSENFGNVVIEGMAAGCPVIVSREVGLAHLVENRRAGVVVDGVEALAGAIAELWRDDARRHELAERGRTLAEQEFSWPVVAEQMEHLYESVLRRPVTDA